MSIFTYAGNVHTWDKTSEIKVGKGESKQTLRLGGHADLTDEEYARLSQQYILTPGPFGGLAESLISDRRVGPRGPVGPPGKTGLSLKGEFKTLEVYAPGDVVSVRGASYASTALQSLERFEDGQWQLIASRGGRELAYVELDRSYEPQSGSLLDIPELQAFDIRHDGASLDISVEVNAFSTSAANCVVALVLMEARDSRGIGKQPEFYCVGKSFWPMFFPGQFSSAFLNVRRVPGEDGIAVPEVAVYKAQAMLATGEGSWSVQAAGTSSLRITEVA